MTKNKIEIGKENFAKITGGVAQEVLDNLAVVDPELGRFIIEFGFGDLFADETISFKTRELLTLSSLVTQGDTGNNLRVHIKAARHVGLSQQEIVASFTHLVGYVGFPRVLNAVFTAKEIFENEKSN